MRTTGPSFSPGNVHRAAELGARAPALEPGAGVDIDPDAPVAPRAAWNAQVALPLAAREVAAAGAVTPPSSLIARAVDALAADMPTSARALRDALIAALNQAGIAPAALTGTAAQATWQGAIRTLGVGGLAPFLGAAVADPEIRTALAGVLAHLELSAQDAATVGEAAAALGDTDVAIAVRVALLKNPTVSTDARKRQLAALADLDVAAGPTLEGALAARPVSMPATAARCVSHPDPRVRAAFAGALAEGCAGLAQLAPALQIRYADALCADASALVRGAALPLTFRGSPRSIDDVARACQQDNGTIDAGRLAAILKTAYVAADIRPAVTIAVQLNDAGARDAAARAVVRSTLLAGPQKAEALVQLAGTQPTAAIVDAVVEYLSTTPGLRGEDIEQLGAPLTSAIVMGATRRVSMREFLPSMVRQRAVNLVLGSATPSAALCAAVQPTEDERVEARMRCEEAFKRYAIHGTRAPGQWTLPQATRAATRLGETAVTRALGWLRTCAIGRTAAEVPDLLQAIAILGAHPELTRDWVLMVLSVALPFVKTNRQMQALGITATEAPPYYTALLARLGDPRLTAQDASTRMTAWLKEMEPAAGAAYLSWLERLGLDAVSLNAVAAEMPRNAALTGATCAPSQQPLGALVARCAALAPARVLDERVTAQAGEGAALPAAAQEFVRGLQATLKGDGDAAPTAALRARADAVAADTRLRAADRAALNAALLHGDIAFADVKRALLRTAAAAASHGAFAPIEHAVAVTAHLLGVQQPRLVLSADDRQWLLALLAVLHSDWPAAFDGLTHLVVARNSDCPAKLVAAPIHQVGANGAYLTVNQPIAVDLEALAALEATGVDLSSVDVFIMYSDHDGRTGSLEVSTPDPVPPDGAGRFVVCVRATNEDGEPFARALEPPAQFDEVIRFLNADARGPEVSLVWFPPGEGAQERVIFRIAAHREDAVEIRLSDLRAAAAFVQQPPPAAA